jgi:acetyltransferase-like isoleucine patch superfamily enzyme
MTSDDLRRELHALYLAREAELREKFDRSLPFGDGFNDRWERARRLGFGEDASIYDSACVFGQVSVGARTWIGPWVMLDGSGGGIRIGSTTSISAGVQIYTHDTVLWALSGAQADVRKGAVSIGDRVYVGSHTVIARGVAIGSMVVIAANSFVNKDVPDRAIVGGLPATPIGHVEGDGADVRLVFDSKVPPDLIGAG